MRMRMHMLQTPVTMLMLQTPVTTDSANEITSTAQARQDQGEQ